MPAGVEFPVGVGLLVLLPPHPTEKSIPLIRTIKSRTMFARFRPRLVPNRNMPNNPKPVLSVHKASMGRRAVPGKENCAVVPAVLTVTVTVDGLVPGVTEVGLTVQVENGGAPSQARLTALEKVPPTGVIDMV